MSDAISSKSTKIYWSVTDADSYTALAEVKSINGPNMSKDQIDVTHLDSSGSYREYIDSFKDGGEVTLDCNFIPAQHVQALNDFNDDNTRDFKIVWGTSNYQWEFSGFYKNVGPAASVGEALKASVTIKVTGAVSQAAVA